jgi:hypothetical protein
MPHWLLKSAAQRMISLLPASHRWNEWFQEHITGSLDLSPERFQLRLDCCRRHLENFRRAHPDCAGGFTVLELGTGWYPVGPVGLYLCGASEIWTYDIAPLLSSARMRVMFECFAEFERDGRLRQSLPMLLPQRLEALRSAAAPGGALAPGAALGNLGIHAHTRDVCQSGLPEGKMDLFVSTGVLEYIPVEALSAILREFQRLGSARALQSHYLNLVDQYSYFDRGIGPFNFLKYSARRWSYLNSPLTWLNRLRISDYRRLLAQAGFEIVEETNTKGRAEDLRKIELAPEFHQYAEEDLLVLTSWLSARPAGRPGPGIKPISSPD